MATGDMPFGQRQVNAADAAVLGISVDAQPAKSAWAQALGTISFDLLSDFHPHGDVATKYGVYRASEGVCERALFVIDKNGKIAWSYLSPMAVNPGADGILDALEQMQSEDAGAGRTGA